MNVHQVHTFEVERAQHFKDLNLSNKDRQRTTLAEHNHHVGVCVAKAVIGVPYWPSGFRRRGARRLDRGRRHGRGHLLHGNLRHCRKCLHGRRRGGRAFARSTGRQDNRRRDDPCDERTAKHRSHSHNSALRPMSRYTATRRWHLTRMGYRFLVKTRQLESDTTRLDYSKVDRIVEWTQGDAHAAQSARGSVRCSSAAYQGLAF